ncbi:MAG: acyl-CoA dehydrogenase family protein [Acidimicrobiales bacterium]
MDFELTEDQALLRETTLKFLESTCPLTTVRELADNEPRGFDPVWWKRAAELGWTSMLVTEDDGGGSVSGHGLVDLALVAEERGRLVAPGPFAPVNVVAEALSRRGTTGQRRRWLPGLLNGETVAAWCLAAPAAGLDHLGTPVVARRSEGNGLVLDGVSQPVEAAAQSELLLVTALGSEGGLVQALVPSDTRGVRLHPARCLDLVRRFAQVTFEGVAVDPEWILDGPGTVASGVEQQLQTTVVLQCAELAGALDRVLEMTVAYAFDRYSFGRPLASYQALKHRFADMKMWVEACHATASAAAHAVDAEDADAAELTSVAKAYIGERGPVIVQECVQLHGGIGVTWDHDIHLYLRRVVVNRTQHGTPGDHRDRVFRAMDAEVSP